MKTLSFVKQALAVALLISASQASAMSTVKRCASAFGSGVKSVLTAHEKSVAWLVRKSLRCEPAHDSNTAQTVEGRLLEIGLAGKYVAGTPLVTRQDEVVDADNQITTPARQARAAQPARWEGGTKGIRNIILHVNTHSKGYLWTTRVALLAAIGYGAYALYNKYYAEAAEEVTDEDNKEDAEPTTEEVVVVVEETTAEPVQPVRSAQSRVFNPAA